VKIFRHVEGPGVVRLALIGELDMDTVEMLRTSVEREISAHPPHRLVIDLASTAFCDSTGIKTLMDARSAATDRGVCFQATNPCGITRKTMQITGVLEILTEPTTAT
jgi:anti-anti-sigma factor